MNYLVNLLILLVLAACQVKTEDGASVIAVSSNYSTTLTATTTITADGVSASTISINVKKNGLAAAGETPTFAATGTSNIIGACSVTDANGDSTCSLKSTKAESKSVAVTTPGPSLPAVVVFTAGSVNSTNTTISGSGPTVANGTAAATITIYVKDAYNNPIPGITPTFNGTDTGTTNVYGACSATSLAGLSTCTLKSTKAEVKTLSLLTPVSKSGGTAIFMGGTPVAANSTITGTGPVIADGVSTSTITVSFLDFYNNPSPGILPTFTATDTGGKNTYGACSMSGITGVSTCTLKSRIAETKTLSLVSPFSKSDGTVVFTPVTVVAANSTITGTSPVVANGIATSTVTITLKDATNSPVAGITPTFSATNTGSTNSYGSCSLTNASGVSTCSLNSLTAETKTLSIDSPVSKSDGIVVFTTPTADPANSTITGTTPVVANGTSTSTITVILKDATNSPVPGVVPTFTATNTGTTNNYGVCSATSALGISSCSLSSLTAESKTLSIATPISKAGGIVVFTLPVADPANSTIAGTGPVIANGTATSTVTITLKDSSNNPVPGQVPTFGATNTGNDNNYGTCSATNASGISTCTLSSSTAETKTLSIATPIIKADGTVVFTSASASALNSTITGTGTVVADGVATSTITITLKDAGNNPVPGQTPTFDATDTSSGNVYTACSSSNTLGVSTCTMKSTVAEVKTLSIQTPVIKAGGTVTFIAGVPVALNSTITGTGPVIANGTATSTVTITLKDSTNNPVSGQTPTFDATDTSSGNVYTACSSSNTLGISTCTMKSTVAEVKTLSIQTPVVKADGTVTFTAGAPVALNSTITGTGPVVANGTATSTVTITLKDASNNPVSGQTPTFDATDTSSGNVYTTCSSSNTLGVSTCTMKSTVAEVKTLSIQTPVVKPDGTVTFTAGAPVALNSSISGTGPVVANGTATSTVTITLKDASNNPVSGQTPTFDATDTSSGNVYTACSSSNASGVSTCTMKSTVAEVKTLSIQTPVVKADGTVTFTAGAPVALNSSITGSGPVVANGTATSTITITLKDASNNPVSGQTPTFDATDTSSGNVYTACSSSNASGVSTCTMKSTMAEVKTLSIQTPVVKADGTVTFTAGAPVALNSNITGTGPVIANGTATSTVTITLKDATNNPVSGQTPTFDATDTSSGNVYTTCSSSNTLGVSTCTMKSTVAEVKTLSIQTPVLKADGTVTFTAGAPVALNSNITGTGPVIANGTATSTVTITLKDASNNPVSGQTPTFDATDTSSGNVYTACSTSNASGISTCTMKSTVAEVKTLSIQTPVVKADGTVTFTAGAAVALNSTITGTGPVVANGTTTSTVTITLKDASNNPVSGQTPTFDATDTSSGNVYTACSSSNASGISTCTMKSTVAEVKTLSIQTPVVKADGTVTFTAGAAVALNSTITGTGPVVANGTATSTVTITLKDASNNPVSGQTPTFDATDTSSGNVYTACSSSNTLGVSTCTMKSTVAEVKTLSIQTPVVKADGTVTFTAGAPVAINSTITGTGPVVANGSSTSTITITLKDASNNPVSGQTPTFDATDTSLGNVYTACSSSNASGISSCTMKSTVAEVKTLSIQTPVFKPDGTVTFTAGAAVALNSTITGTGPVIANGTATSSVTITLKDASNNPVSGQTPTFSATDTATTNQYSTCSVSNSLGVSTCTFNSTVAETKTLYISTPFIKADGTVVFTPGAAVAANSTITGTGPVVANGTAISTVTITLKDIYSNTISSITPTFDATDTSSGNVYTACSSSNTLGVSTCTMNSTVAEVKTLSIQTPVVKADGTVTFTAGAAVAINSTITGTGPVVANGSSTSTVTITLKDASNNPVSGQTPTFDATDTSLGNTYTTCSSSNTLGVSTCMLKSTVAEIKTLTIQAPVVKTDGTVTFTAGAPVAINSTITGSGPVVANGSATSTVTITLKDATNNPVSGQIPTFDATDTSSGNVYTACSSSNHLGVSTCTMNSTVAEVKTLSIQTPVVKADGTVTFTAGAPVALNSTITGTGPVIANGTATSTVTITLKDATNNPVSGETPTFDATNTSSGNLYTACSISNASGVSTCTIKSTVAEVKTLSIQTPVVKADGTVTFTAGAAVAANSSITGTGPVIANGTATSSVTITLKDAANNPVSGQVPTFSATNTNTTNNYGTCSSTDTSGISTCTLASTKAETKTLSIATPVSKADGTVVFTAGPPLAANSSITGSSPVVANGTATSNVSIILRDAFNNPVSGSTPTFSATNTGTTNTYGTCTITNTSGLSSCTLASTKAESKTLSISAPVSLAGGTVVFSAGAASIANSTIIGTGPVTADGVDSSTIIITLKDAYNNPILGTTPAFNATNSGSGNSYGTCSATDSSGTSNCSLKSTMAETKTLSITSPISKADGTVVFNVGSVSIANSSITGTGPVVADGSSTSTVTITLKDASNNPVPDLTPTFSATDTGTTNSYSACSVTDSFGVSTCTFTSQAAEIKTLSIATPVHRSGGTVEFTPGAPDTAHSTITGSGPVVADNSSTSTITITIMDAFHNPISGTIPTFSATSTATNTYTTCSATDSFGVSTCTLKSTKAEIKTLSITFPVTKSDGSVTFTAGVPVAANSHITGTGPTPADGTTSSTITISLKDAFNNSVDSVTPDFSASGTNNSYVACTTSDATGTSTCSMTSTTAETKTLSITSPFTKADGTVQFIAGFPVAANSTISGTSTVIANGVATSTITITLNDASNNPVAGQAPTFSATDTGTTNVYGTCSASNASGVSTCTLTSTKAEIKTLAIATPVSKTGGTVTFVAGSVASTYSTIAGTTNIIANGLAASDVTITLYDAFNNPVSGSVPTFTATNTGTTNIYGVCSSSNTSGVSTCSLKSTKAETKTLAIATPVVKNGSTVNFIAGSADVAHSDITGTSPVSADGVSVSFITINLADAYGNPVVGYIPIFNATNTGSNNTNGTCTATNSSGVASCTLASSYAEVKTLQLTSPIAVTGSTTVTFASGGPVQANSTITGTTPVVADGTSSSTISIILRDASNNPVNGWTPTFDATDTNSKNAYVDCSMSGTTNPGESICSMTSTMAEAKTLRITSPVTKSGSIVTFTAGLPVAANSSISGSSPVTANGIASSTITVNLKDFYNNPVPDYVPLFSATNTGTTNIYGTCTTSDSSGNSTCSLKSTKAENKIPLLTYPVSKSGGAISFVPDVPSATTSTITGTSPVNPDGTSTSTITITIKDAYNNAISGTVPTFSATGATNSYGICTTTDSSGVSTCTLASTTAQTKTLSITYPLSMSGGTVQFITGSAVAANSTITGTGPVTADGTSTSAITITLRDSLNLPVTGQTPVFTASGTGNTISTCTSTNTSGISTCTLKSTKAEVKTLQITSPIVKTDGNVIFIPGAPSVATSTIVGAGPCKATGTDICSVTITIKDAQGNAISGSTPTFSLSGTLNTLNACSVTNGSGVSTCGATSTKAEAKSFQLLTPVSVAGNSVDFNPNGINIQVPIEMLDRGISSKSTAITFSRSRTTLSTTDYVGQMTTYQFEIVADNTNTTTAFNVSLVNSLGTIVPDSVISVPASTTTKRFNVTWTPTAGADNYRVQIAAASGSNVVKVHSARIIVEQTAAIETKIYIPLVGGDATGETNVDTTAAAATSVTGTALAQTPVNNYYPWTRTDTKYDTIASGNSWTLEAVIASNATTATATAQLVDAGGLTIGSALTTTATTPTLVTTSFASTATNFNDADVLSLKLKSSTATNIAYVFRAGLWIKLKFLKKTEIPFRLLNRRAVASTAIMPDARFLWDAGAWSNPTTYFEICAMKSSGTSTIALMDHSNVDFGTASPTPTAVSTLTPPTAYGVYRSPTAITLTDMDRYIIQHVSTSTTAHVMGGAFVIIQARE